MILHILIIILVLLSFAAIRMNNLFYAVITLGVVEVLLAASFYIMAAPDIAITQAAVSSGLATFIFLLALAKTRKVEEE